MGSAPGAALFFFSYESVKSGLKRNRKVVDQPGTRVSGRWNEPVEHMIAASAGEVAACAVRVPTEVVKQRAQAVQAPSSLAALRSILDLRRSVGFVGLWREMYRGWNITLMREVPFTMIQFPLWEGMKEWRKTTRREPGISAGESGFFGSVAGAVAAGVTTPLDVLKTRMMLARERQTFALLVSQLWTESGPRAFFAGIVPRTAWISAGGAIFLGSYQWAYNTLQEVP